MNRNKIDTRVKVECLECHKKILESKAAYAFLNHSSKHSCISYFCTNCFTGYEEFE